MASTDDPLPGLTPKGKRIPDSMEEWRYLAGLYANKLIQLKEAAGRSNHRINTLEQKLAKCRRENEL